MINMVITAYKGEVALVEGVILAYHMDIQNLILWL